LGGQAIVGGVTSFTVVLALAVLLTEAGSLVAELAVD
jgi:hypothetical protein